MDVVIRRWAWLECIVVVSGWFCKEVYRFPHITYPYSTCISHFLQQHPYFFLNVFSFLNNIILTFIFQHSTSTYILMSKKSHR